MNWIPISQFDQFRDSPDYEFYNFDSWTIRDGAIYFSGGRKLRQADVAIFEIVDAECLFVARDDGRIFHAWSLQKKIDRATFRALGDRYFKDDSLAYFEFETSLKPLKGRDSKDFKNLGCGYARDGAFGYFWGAPLRKCQSPKALKVIKATDDKTMDYAMDKEFVYCEGGALKGADLDSWQPHIRGFSIDRNNVFYHTDRLSRVDVDSWQHFSSCYSRDKNHVYCMNRQLKGALPDQWRFLNNDYSTDGERVYRIGNEVPDADVKTFQVSPDGEARDRNGVFEWGERVDDL